MTEDESFFLRVKKHYLLLTERIQDATDEINKNYELSKELDAGFEKVDTSVRAGNNEVNVVKNTLSEMAETVGSARGAMSELMNEMSNQRNCSPD